MVNLVYASKNHGIHKFNPSSNKIMVSKYYQTRFALLLNHGFCPYKVNVKFKREFFISAPIGVHFLALKKSKYILNKLSNNQFGK